MFVCVFVCVFVFVFVFNYATDDEYLFQQIDEPGQPKYLLTTSAISTVKQSWQLLRIADTRPAATDVVAMCNLCRSINWGIIHVDNLPADYWEDQNILSQLAEAEKEAIQSPKRLATEI